MHQQGPGLTRHLAAVMFTDMSGYTALMQRDEAAALRSRARHQSALEASVARRGGEVLQYFGDGSLSIFRSSLEAVRSAVEIQRSLGGDPLLRIGLHLGDIAYDEQGAYGDAINIASRLESLSVPGGILVSQKIRDEIQPHPELAAVPVGTVRLKNVRDAVSTYAIAVEGVVVPGASRPDGGVAAGGDVAGSDPGLPVPVLERLAEHARARTRWSTVTGTFSAPIPLVGRARELETIRTLVDRVEQGRGGSLFIRGARGVGKTRLAEEVQAFARGRGWAVFSGRAYSAERMVPFAPFSDAFLPLLKGLDAPTLEQLAPGGEDALRALFPALGTSEPRPDQRHIEPGELQARLFWHFAGMLARLAAERPLLLVLEDLDFADRSSIELLHFVARRCVGDRILVVCQYVGTDEGQRRSLVTLEQSLKADDAATAFDLDPFTEEETTDFVQRALGLESRNEHVARLAAALFHWTRGNPFFVEGAIRGLIDTGQIEHSGRWIGPDRNRIEVPASVRDAVMVWMSPLTEAARELARLLAVVGTQMTHESLESLSDLGADEYARAIEELLRHQLLSESEAEWTLVYDFRHPLIRETLRAEVSLAKRRMMHARIGASLEAFYGGNAGVHAEELAYHFGQASPGQAGAKAIRYLALAGARALGQHANREAAACFQEAHDRFEALPADADRRALDDEGVHRRVVMGLAKSLRRLGKVPASVALWRRLLSAAEAEADRSAAAQALREIGLAYLAGGQLEEALEEFERGVEAARSAGDVPLAIQIQLAQGIGYHTAGRAGEAIEVVTKALELAEQAGHPGLLAKVHSALIRMNIWTGKLERVRAHAETALRLAQQTGDKGVEFWSEWAMGAMEGLIGNTGEMARRTANAKRLADELGSPFLQMETVELSVELAYARGDWDHGIEIGMRAVELARSLGQRTILPRLLVWISLMRVGRGELEEAERLTLEAWDVSGASQAMAATGYIDVHTVVPAHIGRAALAMARGDWDEAVRIARAGLAIADRTGYVVWAIHHLLPIIAEASIHARNLELANEVGARMRSEAEAVGHPLGLAWADACDAILQWLQGDAAIGAETLRVGAEALESIPLAYEAARMRRQLAGRLAEIGRRAEALEQLDHVRAEFLRLGARPELEKALRQYGELGGR